MAKKRKKSGGGAEQSKARSVAWGGKSQKKQDRLINFGIAGIVLIAVLGGAFWWYDSWRLGNTFAALAGEGSPALQAIEQEPDRGRTHLAVGQPFVYDSQTPLSGPHDPVWTRTGFYRQLQRPTQLVHALEHGNVVVYYDRLSEADMGQLQAWTELFDGQWDGLIATPLPGLGEKLVLTAWQHRLTLESFDAAAAAAFIDRFRGRGPEHPVR